MYKNCTESEFNGCGGREEECDDEHKNKSVTWLKVVEAKETLV